MTLRFGLRLKLEYISGLAMNIRAVDPIYEHMIADRIYPTSFSWLPKPCRKSSGSAWETTCSRHDDSASATVVPPPHDPSTPTTAQFFSAR